MRPIKLLIADDHELVRRGLVAAICDQPGWLVVAQAANGREACELAAQHVPDIAVLDLSMPELNGLETTRHLHASHPKLRILIVTAHESEQLIREVLDAGAMGYVLKSDAGTTLVSAIQALLQDQPFFTSKVGRQILAGYLSTPPPAGTQPGMLSPRERQIVQLLAEGNNNKEIARLLDLSIKTVETHRGNIMSKMQFDSLADLVRYAVRNNIVDP